MGKTGYKRRIVIILSYFYQRNKDCQIFNLCRVSITLNSSMQTFKIKHRRSGGLQTYFEVGMNDGNNVPPLPEVATEVSPSWAGCWLGVSVVVWSPEGTLDPWDKRKRGVGRPEHLSSYDILSLRLWHLYLRQTFFFLNITDGGCKRVLLGFFLICTNWCN